MYSRKEDIPGYREEFARAFRRQQEARDLAFLDVPRTLCGEPVEPITLRQAHRLEYARNPFLVGGEPTAAHALALLWQIHPSHKDGLARSIRRRRVKISRRICRKMSGIEIVSQVSAFVDATFFDSGYISGGRSRPPLPIGTVCDSLIVEIAQSLGWSESQILNCPLERLFLYRKRIRMAENPEYRPKQLTDLVNEKYVAILNRARKEDNV